MKINISIDDISPRPGSDTECLAQCEWLIKRYPDIKFTLFIPAAYQRFADGDINPYPVTPEFADIINTLPKNNFEVGCHGVHHGTPYPINNNNEFQDIHYCAALYKLCYAVQIFERSGLFVKNLFRPSAYRMSPEVFKACEVMQYVLCLKKAPYLDDVYGGFDLKYPCGVVYMDVSPGYDPWIVKDKVEVVYHALKKDKSFLDQNKAEDLARYIDKNKPDFCFMEGLLW